jgi:peptidoglycan/LPS O-acetylase OafA/YrhL
VRLAVLVALSGVAVGICAIFFGGLDGGYNWSDFVVGLARVMFSFFVGVLLFRLRLKFEIGSVSPIIIVAVLLIVLFVKPPDYLQAAYDVVVVIVLMPLIVFVGSYSKPKTLTLICTTLGGASYGIYVLQVPAYLLAQYFLGQFFNDTPTSVYSAVLFTTILVAACVAFTRYFDVPARRFIAKSIMARLIPPRKKTTLESNTY